MLYRLRKGIWQSQKNRTVWELLSNRGVSVHIIRCMMNLHKSNRSYFYTDSKRKIRNFETKTSLQQTCVLSLFLFTKRKRDLQHSLDIFNQELRITNHFKYLGTIINNNGSIEADMNHIINATGRSRNSMKTTFLGKKRYRNK